MEFWQGFIVLSLLAILFILWPTFFGYLNERKALRQHQGGDVQENVYKDQLAELEKNHAMGDIDEKHFNSLKSDLSKTFTQDQMSSLKGSESAIVSGFKSRIPLVVVALLCPIFTIIVYQSLGAKDDWSIYELAKEFSSTNGDKEVGTELVETLQGRLVNDPSNPRNWYLLASTSASIGDYDESVRAYKKLREMEPGSPFVIAELAQALFLRSGNTITPEVREHTQLALSLSPNLPTALGLAGIDAYQKGDYQEAINMWQSAVKLLDPKSSASKALSQGIGRAKVALGTSGKTSTKKVASAALNVEVTIDESTVKLDGTETLFVYARAWQGAKMPLAIKRLSAKDLPAKVVLDSSSAMAQGMDITSVSQLEVVARISKSGMASPSSGDWIATAGPIFLNSQKGAIPLKISTQIP